MNLFWIFFKNTSVFYNLTLKITFQNVGVQKIAAICEAALMCITLQNSFRYGRLCFGPPQNGGEAWPRHSLENNKLLESNVLWLN
jgi:hypothetical protein